VDQIGESVVDKPSVTYAPRRNATPEAELEALAAIYRLCISKSQTSKRGLHDLTNHSTPKTVKNGLRTTGQEET
jgi:hypothetical protein